MSERFYLFYFSGEVSYPQGRRGDVQRGYENAMQKMGSSIRNRASKPVKKEKNNKSDEQGKTSSRAELIDSEK